MQSVRINTKVVILNPSYGEVYSIQLYVIKFFGDLRWVDCFLRALRFLDCYDIAEILLKVALSTINLTPSTHFVQYLLTRFCIRNGY